MASHALVVIDGGGNYPAIMANRLRDQRTRRGLTIEQVAERLDLSVSQVSRLERGESDMSGRRLRQFAKLYDCQPEDLLADRQEAPIAWAVASAFSEDRPDDFELATPHEMVPVPRRLRGGQDLTVADVVDDSADGLYPAGSLLFLRPVEAGDRLRPGERVVVRRFQDDRQGGQTLEVLVGVLDRTMTGDLVLSVRSANRQIPPTVMIQEGSDRRRAVASFSEAQAVVQMPIVDFAYAPKDDDPAEILGRVVWVSAPQ